MKFSESLAIFLGGLFGLGCLMFLAGIGIYSYETTNGFLVGAWIILQNLALIGAAVCAFCLFFPPNHKDFVTGMASIFLMVAYMYILSDFSIYLAKYWRVNLSPYALSNMSIPLRIVEAVFGFLADFSDAVTGYRPNFVSANQHNVVPNSVAERTTHGSAILSWLGESVWNIVLGVVSTFVAAWRLPIQRAASR
jgi:hypothetical protein